MIWDSMAITEYVNEKFPKSGLYPEDVRLRATARSCMAEMHSGFMDLRLECAFNMKRKSPKSLSQKALKDLQRIYQIWDFCKKISGDKAYLLGEWGAIDAFFAPVVSRIVSYDLERESHAGYIDQVLTHPHFQEWKEEALKEISIN